MKRCLLIFLLPLTALPVTAQIMFHHGWSIWCEYMENNLQQTSDGGYILCTDAVPEMDTVNNISRGYLLKLDSAGILQWAIEFPKSNYFVKARDANAVVQTWDGGYAVATSYYNNQSSTHTSIYVIRTNSLGGLLWSKMYPGLGNSSSYCITEAANHDLLIAGSTADTSSLFVDRNAYLLRTDAAGNVIWANYYQNQPPSNIGRFHTCIEASDSSIVASGALGSAGVVMKADANGNVVWATGPVVGSENYDVMETVDGRFMTCGSNYGAMGVASLVQLDPAGTYLWGYNYPRQGSSTSGGDIAYSVAETGDGYVFAIRDLQQFFGGLIKVDTAGVPMWGKLYINTHLSIPIDLERTTDNGYVLSLNFRHNNLTANSHWRTTVLKTDSLGNNPCDSVITDSSVAINPYVTLPLNVGSATPMVTMPSVLHYIILPDTVYCPSISVDVPEHPPAFATNIFPNPAGNEVRFAVSGLSGGTLQLGLYNIAGQEVSTVLAENVHGEWSTSLNTALMPDGLYFLRITIDNVVYRSVKLVIEH